jgi:hypothetical protein
MHKTPLLVRSYQSALVASIINNYFFIIFFLATPPRIGKVGATKGTNEAVGTKRI